MFITLKSLRQFWLIICRGLIRFGIFLPSVTLLLCLSLINVRSFSSSSISDLMAVLDVRLRCVVFVTIAYLACPLLPLLRRIVSGAGSKAAAWGDC